LVEVFDGRTGGRVATASLGAIWQGRKTRFVILRSYAAFLGFLLL
jgi:hypothetical protein